MSGRPWLRVAPALLMLAWGGNHFTPLLHLYAQLGHYARWQVNLLLGVYVFGLAPALFVVAALSDRLGRKPVFVAGVVISVGASALLAVGAQSYLLLCLGRVLAGASVAVAMAVGTPWLKALSQAPFEHHHSPVIGAKRGALTLTLGFAGGAGVTGTVAQFAPLPALLPYVVHVCLSLLCAAWALTAPESSLEHDRPSTPWWQELRVPDATQPRFTRVIIPAAPWVFGAAGLAYAVIPASLEAQLGDLATIYATVLTVVSLGLGAVVQSFAPRIDRATRGNALPVGLITVIVGLLLAVAATGLHSIVFGVVVGLILGMGYGCLMVAGLMYVQRMATPTSLAGLTGVYYALTYIGFLIPTLVAALLPVVTYSISIAGLALIACCSLILTVRALNAQEKASARTVAS